jgi:hypothetical protein
MAKHDGLMELFQGEVIGESLFDRMLPNCEDSRQRYVVGTMLQLETETKARLRQAAAERGMDFWEDDNERTAGEGMARDLASASWEDKMRAIHDVLRDTYVPRYKEIAATAPAEDKELADYMVVHETSLFETTRRELAGDTENSIETILPQLRYPLPVPDREEA